MTKLIIRHGLSEANNNLNYGTPAFGNPKAPLMPKGQLEARELGARLVNEYGFDLGFETVAVSEMRRSQQTALFAGFGRLHVYPSLNEEKGGLSDEEIKVVLTTKSPPEATRLAARLLIENPPVENIWITHALLIATICQELGIYTQERFTPRFCEIRELSL